MKHVERMRKMKSTYKTLVGLPEGNNFGYVSIMGRIINLLK